MPLSATAGLVFGVAVMTVIIYHAAFVGPRLSAIGAGIDGAAVAGRGDSLARLQTAQTSLAATVDERIGALESMVRRDFHRVGFVRYNAFDDVGSDQSFTLALLNGDGDGVVLTSIFSRTETRTFGKSVRKYVPQQGASKEEQSAIAMARTGLGS